MVIGQWLINKIKWAQNFPMVVNTIENTVLVYA